MKSLRVLAAFLCLFSGFAMAQERQKVIVWGVKLGPTTKGLEAVVREFERRNPDVKLVVTTMGAGGMNPQKLMTAIVGKVPPDVIAQDRFTLADWASRGAFQPLDELIARDAGKDPLTPTPDQFYTPAWDEAKYDGKIYGIPTEADNRILYYNKEIFRKKAKELRAAGLDPDRAPRTWSEILAYSKVLTEYNKDGSIKIAGFLPNYGNVWLYMYAFQNNANFMSADGSTCTMATPEAAEALAFMVKGYDAVGGYQNALNFQSGFLSDLNDSFVIGKVAMKIDGEWIIRNLARYGPKLDFGAAPPPVPDDRFHKRGRFADEPDQFVTWMGGFSYAIPTGARNRDGAWRFIKWATSLEGRLVDMREQKAWETRLGREYVPPLSAHIQASEIGATEFTPTDPRIQSAKKLSVELQPFARYRPKTVVAQMLWDEHVRAVENACLKKMTPMEALQKGQDTVNRELKEINSQKDYPVVSSNLPVWIASTVIALAIMAGVIAFMRKRIGRLERTEAKWAYFFISPWIIGFLVLTIGPMIASLFYSFTMWNVLGEAHWVGVKNYADLAGYDRDNVTKSLANVFYLGGIGVPLSLMTGLAVAMLLNAAVRGMRFYRTLFYMPSIVPIVASAVLWAWILASDPTKGLMNSWWQSTIGEWFGTTPPGWLNAETWAKPALIVQGLWGAGGGMILWLAGLKGISNTLYEASSLDGASPTKQFFFVTLPQLSPVIFFNTVMGFIGALQEFDRVYIMKPADSTGAGPADSLLVPVYLLFTNGFSYFKMGYASAIAWGIFAVILILTGIQFKLAPKWVHYEVEK
ncbi:MAG: extracellular solute-binding protein [Fimbriimonadaceae bacterium]|nr:extracellular solute-binding protein [Fimbriimonadaceae bacterium]